MKVYQLSKDLWTSSSETAEARGPAPQFPTPTTFDDIEKEFRARHIYFTAQLAFVVSHNKKYQPISNWIDATVDPVMLETIQTQLLAEKKRSLQDLIRALKRIYAPSEVSSMTTIQEEYQAILKQAITGSVNPQKWHADWFRAYNRAKLVGLPEVEGVLAAKTFLKAVGARLTPSWSLQEQMDLVKCAELSRDTTSLDDLKRIFRGLAADNAMSGSKKTRVFATIKARSDIKTSTRSNTKISVNETYLCFYKKTDIEKKHS